jgi:AraC-like DNA-binding protein
MAINSCSGYNFKEYINKYRILHAKEMLSDPKFSALSIAAIAYDCGFNSLSSFNSAFKKITGKTPSSFKKSID